MFDVFYSDRKPDLFAFERPADSIEQAAELSRTEFFWYIHGNNDYTGFDFTWQPAPWEKDQVHVFASQWQRNGDVYFARKWTAGNREWHFRSEQSVQRLVDMSKWTVPELCNTEDFDFSWHPDTIEPDYEYRFPTQHQREGGPIYNGSAGIKYCNSQRVRSNATQIFYMDFLDPGSAERYQKLQVLYPDIKRTRYVDNHLTVFKRIVNLATTEFVWITSSICDYTDFDFTWHPEESQREMIHCFYSESQKRGDTFLIHVQSFKNQMYDLELLDWFNVINYVDSFRVPRVEMPVHYYQSDDLVSEVKNYQFTAPYALFSNQPDLYTHWHPCLWTEKDRVATSFTISKAVCALPRDVKTHLRTQIYDYPYIDNRDVQFFAEEPIDIIYISYDEPQAEENWNKLVTKFPKAKRVHGIKGMENELVEAAKKSETSWFYAVFAKTEIHEEFNFSFQPDYFQESKHYIFYAKNRVNGLVYGEMGIIMYNCKLIIERAGQEFEGLDYTLSFPHEVIPELSAYGNFDTSPYHAWRTAFRETSKLYDFYNQQPTIDTKYRLKIWETVATGPYADWVLKGSSDGKEFFHKFKDDPIYRKNSFSWEWLREYFVSRYGNLE